MAFRNKCESIMRFDPDLLIIQECENPEKVIFKDLKKPLIDAIWVGDNKHKGLAVFSFSYKIKIPKFYNPEHKYILPIKFNNSYILAVWAMNDKINPERRYIAQIWSALNEYKKYLKDDIIIIGDFNSNKIWDNDKPYRIANHSQVVEYLNNYNIISLYHELNREDQGNESVNTFYLYRKKNKGYHIDYCFISNNLINNISNFRIGKFNEWINLSDHCPLILDINY